MAIVKVSLGKTINLGNYQSARYDVGVELNSEVDANLDPTQLFELAKGMAQDQLERAIKDKLVSEKEILELKK